VRVCVCECVCVCVCLGVRVHMYGCVRTLHMPEAAAVIRAQPGDLMALTRAGPVNAHGSCSNRDTYVERGKEKCGAGAKHDNGGDNQEPGVAS
jgi:hypothetical protein